MAAPYPPHDELAGENFDLFLSFKINSTDGVALLHFNGGEEKNAVAQPCSFIISQYRFQIGPLHRSRRIDIPYFSIAQWSIATASSAAVKAFTRAQDEADRTAECSTAPGVSLHSHTSIAIQNSSLQPPASTGGREVVEELAATAAPTSQRLSSARRPPSLHVLTLQTKHLFVYRVLLSGASAVPIIKRRLIQCHGATRLDQMPAFLYHAARQESGHGPTPPAAPPSMWRCEFGWYLYTANRETSRQLCRSATTPPLLSVSDDDMASGRAGVGVDLRPWFHCINLREGGSREGRPSEYCYTASPTYPDALVEPRVVDETLLLRATAARSRARVPAISFVHLATGAVVARGAQPLLRSLQLAADSDICYALINAGYSQCHRRPQHRDAASAMAMTTSTPVVVRGSAVEGRRQGRPPSLFDDDSNAEAEEAPDHRHLDRDDPQRRQSAADIKGSSATIPRAAGGPPPSSAPAALAAASRGTDTAVLAVMDCRPLRSATANMQAGGGYELGSLYDFCSVAFYDIDNIFAVQKAFEKLRDIVAQCSGDVTECEALRRFYKSEWLQLTQRVLSCGVAVVKSIERGVSCLVHCTDGWDRTSQCTTLAMLLLDPFYRTVVGFCILLEKEFMSFGHRFAERCGHQVQGRTSIETHAGVPTSDTEGSGHRPNASPIFYHFMDVVYQVHRQYPTCFEFSTRLLERLAVDAYSCLYGTFLCNGEQERRLEGVQGRTPSIWTDILRQVQLEKNGEAAIDLVNIQYDAATAWKFISRRATAATPATPAMDREAFVLMPSTSSKRLFFWADFYLREDADHFLLFNPRTIPVPVKQRISWGAPFDEYLQSYIDAACLAWLEETEPLRALEAFMAHEEVHGRTSSRLPTLMRSSWCVHDPVCCLQCYRPFTIWSSKVQCPACKVYLCSECVAHDCVMRPR